MAEKALINELEFALDIESMIDFCKNEELNKWSENDSEEKLAKTIYNSGKFTLDRFNVPTLKLIVTDFYKRNLEGARTKDALIERILDLRTEKQQPETNGHATRLKTYGQTNRSSSPSRGQKRKASETEETHQKKRTPSPSRGQKRKASETEETHQKKSKISETEERKEIKLTTADHQRRELNVFDTKHLKEICSEKKLSPVGSKNELIDILIEDGIPLSELDAEELQKIITKLYKDEPVSDDDESELANQIRDLRKKSTTTKDKSPSPKKGKESYEDEEGQVITLDRIKGFGDKVLREALKHEWNVKVSQGADVYNLVFKKFKNADFTWNYFSKCATKYL
jgi:hypothetical protein